MAEGRSSPLRWRFVAARLRDRGAALIEHPGGTLLGHLRRVARRLKARGAAGWLALAGFCHAAYGTAGFPRALFALAERPLLVSWIGARAEALVYLYCACDRRSAPGDGWPATVGDRFTGAPVSPSVPVQRALLELTIANEEDVLAHAHLPRDDRSALVAFVAACRARRAGLGR